MRLNLTALVVVLVLSAASAPAYAQGDFYIGAGADHFSDGFNGGDIAGGWQISRYYALEVGLTTGAESISDGYGGSVVAAIAELTADGYGFLPLGRRSNVSLFATAGVASIGLAERDYYGDQVSASGAGLRAGAGLDWSVSRHSHLRLTGRYQSVNIAGYLGNDGTVSLQYLYHF